MRRSLCAWLLVFLFIATRAAASERTVVVLLFDGFAPSLLDVWPIASLDFMRQEGAWTHHMIPAFPTISLINQTTISTGCWPEHHGIVTNLFIDPQRGVYDHSHDADWLIGCEHMHQAAERQGVRSAALGWVGRTSSTRGDLATRVSAEKSWSDFPSDDERARQVMSLLMLPDKERPRLILAYFRGPDAVEHFKGMNHPDTRQAVETASQAIGHITDTIRTRPFADQVTLIVTTDHGMINATYNVNVQKILANHGIKARFLSTGSTSFVYLDDKQQVDRAVRELSGYDEAFDVVRKDVQPPEWHIGTGPRVGDLILSAKPPYFIEDIERWPWWSHWLGTWGPEFLWARYALKATHGYPPTTKGMDGIFYAWGAGIAKGRQVASLRAIDIHPTVMALLGIQPGNPVDGVVATEFFVAPPTQTPEPTSTPTLEPTPESTPTPAATPAG
ncbi:MAG TPA: alkaline phosphatase family protein [Candidatus Acidoferrales bacterium]|nr:alkaline phosphatase family protein [Candidatus Acidoferrales bacterium]